MGSRRNPASFRDPAGFVFSRQGTIYRQVNVDGRQSYDLLMDSGLYGHLVDNQMLIPHEEVTDIDSPSPENAFKVLKPRRIPFTSYPYEWSFSQLKDAAFLTLEIQKTALEHGASLKDGSAYNVQFTEGRPVFIDTLSFEKYEEGMPWTPYRQFCQHFLAPLALMSLVDVRLGRLARLHIDGIPLDLTSKLLPWRTRFSSPMLLHLHLHSRTQQRYSDKTVGKTEFKGKMSRNSLLGLLESLKSCVMRLDWKPVGTEWADYYEEESSYSPAALEHKKNLVSEFLAEVSPKTVWDLGANTGLFSRIARDGGADVVAFDVDPACVEANYRLCKKQNERRILPLLIDLTSPSPGLGWRNTERVTLADRGPADVALALALVHHLAISNNVPLEMVAGYLGELCGSLIIEFVPKSDPQVQRLLATREDVFVDYSPDGFESAFVNTFEIRRRQKISDSDRILYLMARK